MKLRFIGLASASILASSTSAYAENIGFRCMYIEDEDPPCSRFEGCNPPSGAVFAEFDPDTYQTLDWSLDSKNQTAFTVLEELEETVRKNRDDQKAFTIYFKLDPAEDGSSAGYIAVCARTS